MLLQELARLRAPDTIIVEEAPSSREPMHDHLPILRPETFYTCSSGGLGHSMPAAVGVALGRPGTKVIALIGDGSAMYAIQALWSAAQLQLPIAFIIVNNARYEALRQFSGRFGIERPVGTELPGIDFVELASAQGCEGLRVTRAGELLPALRHALAASGPVLVDVVVA
jgi:benzoylformate decarboxylase